MTVTLLEERNDIDANDNFFYHVTMIPPGIIYLIMYSTIQC